MPSAVRLLRSAPLASLASLMLAGCFVGGAPPDDEPPPPPPPPSDEPRAPFETQPLFDDAAGGLADADDPAIWVHPTDPMASLVIVTKKTAGLSVFDMNGTELIAIAAPPAPTPLDAPGRFNNVDLLYGLRLGGQTVDVAVTTDRGYDRLRFYAIDPRGSAAGAQAVRDVTSADAPQIFTTTQAEINEEKTAYGLAAWTDPGGTPYAIVTQASTTTLARVEVVEAAGKLSYMLAGTKALPNTFMLPGGASWTPCTDPGELAQSEGMVIDRESGMLYVGQEMIGIWRLRSDFTGPDPVLLEKTKEFGVPATLDPVTEECVVSGPDPGVGGRLAGDVEGLSIYYRKGDGVGYLLASAQGENKFAVYERSGGNAFIGTFAIGGAAGLDGVEECDGLDLTNAPIGGFTHGMVVMQDGNNEPAVLDELGAPRDNTNFKFLPWDVVAKDLNLAIETDGWRPR